MPSPTELIKLLGMWNNFNQNHPKFSQFLQAASKPDVLAKDTIVEMKVTTAAGRTLNTSLRITADDLRMLEQLKTMRDERQSK